MNAATLTDFAIGDRVMVPNRKGATGTVVRLNPARSSEGVDTIQIAFDGAGVGFNYPSQVEHFEDESSVGQCALCADYFQYDVAGLCDESENALVCGLCCTC